MKARAGRTLTVGEAEAKRLLELPNAFQRAQTYPGPDNYNLPPATGTSLLTLSRWKRFLLWLGLV